MFYVDCCMLIVTCCYHPLNCWMLKFENFFCMFVLNWATTSLFFCHSVFSSLRLAWQGTGDRGKGRRDAPFAFCHRRKHAFGSIWQGIGAPLRPAPPLFRPGISGNWGKRKPTAHLEFQTSASNTKIKLTSVAMTVTSIATIKLVSMAMIALVNAK